MKNVMDNVPHEVLEATCSTAPAGNRRESGLTHLDLYKKKKKVFWSGFGCWCPLELDRKRRGGKEQGWMSKRSHTFKAGTQSESVSQPEESQRK